MLSVFSAQRMGNRMLGQRGLSLVELFVVISIISALSLVFWSLLAGLRGSDPIEQFEAQLHALVERGRAKALAENSRFELYLDYENNTLQLFERSPVALYSFERTIDPFGKPLHLKGGAHLSSEGIRLNGKALYLSGQRGQAASVELPFDAGFNPLDQAGGVVVSFDLFVDAMVGETGVILERGRQWSIEVVRTEGDVCWLEARIQDLVLEVPIGVAIRSWSRVELVINPRFPGLYLNEIPVLAGLREERQRMALDLQDRSPIIIGGSRNFSFALDNLRVERQSTNRDIQLEEAWFLPPGSDPKRASRGELWSDSPEDLLEERTKVRISDGSQEDGGGALLPLPLDSSPRPEHTPDGLPVRAALIFFNQRGELDRNIHSGDQRIILLSLAEDGREILHQVTLSSLGNIHLESFDSVDFDAIIQEN